MPVITQANRTRLQAKLRTLLGSNTLTIDPPETQHGTAQLRVNNDVLGTIDQIDEEGERSWAVTMIVLEEDF